MMHPSNEVFNSLACVLVWLMCLLLEGVCKIQTIGKQLVNIGNQICGIAINSALNSLFWNSKNV